MAHQRSHLFTRLQYSDAMERIFMVEDDFSWSLVWSGLNGLPGLIVPTPRTAACEAFHDDQMGKAADRNADSRWVGGQFRNFIRILPQLNDQ